MTENQIIRLIKLTLILVTLGGLFSLGKFFHDFIYSKCSENWKCVKAKVLEKSKYKLDIKYKFQLNSKSYTGDRYVFGDVDEDDVDQIKKIYNQIIKNNTVTVYYDPSNPENNVILRGIHFWYLIEELIVGIETVANFV